jgi:hypothetical protein
VLIFGFIMEAGLHKRDDFDVVVQFLMHIALRVFRISLKGVDDGHKTLAKALR